MNVVSAKVQVPQLAQVPGVGQGSGSGGGGGGTDPALKFNVASNSMYIPLI